MDRSVDITWTDQAEQVEGSQNNPTSVAQSNFWPLSWEMEQRIDLEEFDLKRQRLKTGMTAGL